MKKKLVALVVSSLIVLVAFPWHARGAGDSCADCGVEKCRTPVKACHDDIQCQLYSDCRTACKTDSCKNECAKGLEDGKRIFDRMIACLAAQCREECKRKP